MWKLRVIGLCERDPPVTRGFPHKRPVTRKMFPFDDVIMATKIVDIFKLNCLKFQKNITNINAPKYFKDLFTRNLDLQSCETKNRGYTSLLFNNKEGSFKRIRRSILNLIDSL